MFFLPRQRKETFGPAVNLLPVGHFLAVQAIPDEFADLIKLSKVQVI
jgi:hypothetical protein